MDKKDFVTLEVAKLLREKGFNEGCLAYYDNNSDSISYIGSLQVCNVDNLLESSKYMANDSIISPTLYQAQKWLRENHKIYVSPLPKRNKNKTIWYYELTREINNIYGGYNSDNNYDSYEESLNEGIKESLKLI